MRGIVSCPHSSKPLFEVSTVDARSCRALISWKKSTARRPWLTGAQPPGRLRPAETFTRRPVVRIHRHFRSERGSCKRSSLADSQPQG